MSCSTITAPPSARRVRGRTSRPSRRCFLGTRVVEEAAGGEARDPGRRVRPREAASACRSTEELRRLRRGGAARDETLGVAAAAGSADLCCRPVPEGARGTPPLASRSGSVRLSGGKIGVTKREALLGGQAAARRTPRRRAARVRPSLPRMRCGNVYADASEVTCEGDGTRGDELDVRWTTRTSDPYLLCDTEPCEDDHRDESRPPRRLGGE